MLPVKAPPLAFPPEIELLLCCARTRLDHEHAHQMTTLLESKVDWSLLLSAARGHGMLPLLHRHLRSSDAGSVPTSIVEELSASVLMMTRRNLSLTGELVAILALFEQHGIAALPFKGPVLAGALYGSVSLRPFCDLDILIRRRNLPLAKALLVSRGYQPLYHLTSAQEEAFIDASGVLPLACAAGRFAVDLHSRLARKELGFKLDFDQLWERRVKVSLAGNTFYTFSSADLLLYLCVHGSKHLWERLEWICGVAELTKQSEEINWIGLLQQAERVGYARALLLGLALSQDLLQAVLPPCIEHQLSADSVVTRLASQVRVQLVGDGHPTPIGTAMFHLRMRERWQDKIRLVFILTTPSTIEMKLLPLPQALFWLYPLIRLLRLLGKYAHLPSVRKFWTFLWVSRSTQ